MNKQSLIIAVLITALLSANISMAFAKDRIWSENWGTDTIQDTSPSFDDWYEAVKNDTNVTWGHSADGILTLTAEVTGAITSNSYTLTRNVTTTGSIKFTTKLAFYGDGNPCISLGTSGSAFSTAYIVWQFYIIGSTGYAYFKYRNATGNVIDKWYEVITANEWYTLTVEWSRVPNKYTVQIDNSTSLVANFTIEDSKYDNTDAVVVFIDWGLGTDDTFGRLYFDYIRFSTFGSFASSLEPMINLLLYLAMFSAIIGMVAGISKKMGKW